MLDNAMPMRPEDLALFTRHLSRRAGYGNQCPQCHSSSWTAEGPYVAPRFSDGHIMIGSGMPFVVKICSNCFYMIPFAWLPMVDADAREGGSGG